MERKRRNKIGKIVEKSRNGFLEDWEVEVLRRQVRSNSSLIDHYIYAIDLLANKERCPKDANTLAFLRGRLSVAMAENDTFRKVLWRHAQLEEAMRPVAGDEEAAFFLIRQIKSRKSALMAQLAMK
ncbi:MAG: hypothetical protein HY584_06170 [Candidatus Omnitrophica bacterium]|nr:hypothetical protein [Candidatus Omnitrophota bacterium]